MTIYSELNANDLHGIDWELECIKNELIKCAYRIHCVAFSLQQLDKALFAG